MCNNIQNNDSLYHSFNIVWAVMFFFVETSGGHMWNGRIPFRWESILNTKFVFYKNINPNDYVI